MKAKITLCTCLLSFIACIPAFPQLYSVSRYADDNGLPSRIVHDVIQDSTGFLWVAGNNGLFKYDGKSFTPFRAALKDTIGLRDNKVNVVLQTKDRRIWAGTPKGLHVLTDNQIRFVRLHDQPVEEQEYILDIFEDSEQNLWISTYGGLYFKEVGKEAVHFIPGTEHKGIAKEGIWSVNQDFRGNVWIAAKTSPYIVDLDKPMKFERVITRQHPSIDLNETELFRFSLYNDTLMLIESNRGLLKGTLLSPRQIEISKFSDVEGNYLEEFHINDVIVDQQGFIWIATAKNYYKKYDLIDGSLKEIEVSSKNGYQDITENIRSISEDQQGNIWMANSNGLYKFSPAYDAFTTYPPADDRDCLPDLKGIYAMVEDRWGYLWLNTPYQLYRIKKTDLLIGRCPESYLVYDDEHMQQSRNLFIDSKDRLWVGADGGLFVAQLRGNAKPSGFKRFTTKDGLPHNWSFEVLEIEEDLYWVGNYAGLVKLHFPGGNMEDPEIEVYASDSNREGTLINSQSNELAWGQNGQLWVGTFSGLSRLLNEEGKGSFANYTNSFRDFNSLSNNSVKKIFFDHQDRMWIATQRGLNLYLPTEDAFQQFGIDEGLPSEYILGIQEDSEGYLWIGTTNGVLKARFYDESMELVPIEHFTAQSGLADNIPYRNAILILDDDTVLIGSREGISVSSKSEKHGIPESFNLALTGLETTQDNQDGFKSILHRVKNNHLALNSSENSLRLSYAALDFTNSKYNSYRHKILPVNDEWIETEGNSDLAYYNLAPGEYELILDGNNTYGTSASNPIRLQINISPPFWRSNWAIALYTVLGLLTLRLLYLYRIRKKMNELERKTAHETELMREREQLRKENAADFHDELGSKVTKISLFLTLAERSLEESSDPRPWLNKIRENIKALSGGFRDLLWVIDPHKDSLVDTFLRLKDFGEDLFENTEINFRVNGLEDIPENRLLNAQTKKQVVLIFKEAMTNCLKYANCDQVDFKIHTNGEYSSMSLQDNGTGFQISNKHEGRGLKNMHSRSDKIGTTLKICSSEDGTEIVLERIPHTRDINM